MRIIDTKGRRFDTERVGSLIMALGLGEGCQKDNIEGGMAAETLLEWMDTVLRIVPGYDGSDFGKLVQDGGLLQKYS
jgi:hypothetical protein